MRRLDAPTTASRWEAAQTRILALGSKIDLASADRYALDFPAKIRTLLETRWLPEAAVAADPRAKEEALAVARLWSQALSKGGEPLYAESLAVLETPKDAFSASRNAEGLRLYADALNSQSDCSKAEPLFESAASRLAEAENPLSRAAQLGQLVCLYRRRPQAAEERFQALAHLPYPTLAAKAEKMSGLCAIADGRYSEAVAHDLRAADLFATSGDPEVFYIHGMLAEAYRFLGDRARMWPHRIAALRGATITGDFRLRHSVLFGLAQELAETSRSQAAHPVLDEMLLNARAWREPGAEAETLIRRINLHLAEGKPGLAAADIATCERIVKGYQQPADRARVTAELKISAAEQKLGDHPAEAQKDIQAAVAAFAAMGEGLLLPRALLTLARADLAVGDFAGAEDAFRRTLNLYEDRRTTTIGEESRIRFFATAQKSFDAMIRFEAVDRADATAALQYAEQARVRGLREHLDTSTGMSSSDLDLDTLLHRLPPEVAAFEFAVLPDVLVVWRLYHGSLALHVLPASREKVTQVVRAVRLALRDATSGEPAEKARVATAQAFDTLLAPAMAGIPPGTELVIVPDRELHQLPFAALFDSSRGHYLVEDHPSLVSPSLSTYLSSLDGPPIAPGGLQRALVVGEPTLDSQRFSGLFPLPFARREAETLAALYPKKTLLTGDEASRAKILAALPGSTVVHLAAHVLMDSRTPMESLIATADPADAVLRASELGTRNLAGVQLVFLAACDTAPGFGDGDREGVAGLARAVLAAGVPFVVATLWPVGDRSIAGLPQMFHARLLARDSPARALQRAQLALLYRGLPSRPFAWTAFQLFATN